MLIHDRVAELAMSPGYAALGGTFATHVDPTPLPDPYLVAFNAEFARDLGFEAQIGDDPAFLRIAAGNARFAGVPSTASVYAGYQFGQWVPRLGDGRAIALGELAAPGGGRWEWQLKGAGPTPYSRFGDGRAVLRSTIREYLASEALHHLGIPTTRALAIAGSDATVYRESVETAAVLSRLAPSHLRFGHYQYFASIGALADLEQLAEYTLETFHPDLAGSEDRYGALLERTAVATGELFAAWQAVGFAHGVLNTDNLSVLGLTLDYGPYGWLEAYDPNYICNHSDDAGRYAFGAQPSIGLWNLRTLAVALESLIAPERRGTALAAYPDAYNRAYQRHLREKFGFATERQGDLELMTACFELLLAGGSDYTRFFRSLALVDERPGPVDPAVTAEVADADRLEIWLAQYRERLATERRSATERRAAMDAVNPKYVLRNHLAQAAIERAQARDYSEIERLSAVLRRPYDEQPGNDAYAEPRSPDVPEVGVSCSS